MSVHRSGRSLAAAAAGPPAAAAATATAAAAAAAAAGAAAGDEVRAPGDVAMSSSTLRPKEKRTLWVGDLDRAEGVVDEVYIRSHMFLEFSACITSVRICRDKVSRQPSFGFVEFSTQQEAQYVLEHMNGRFVPGRMHKYRLNWAHFNLTETQEPRTSYSRPAQLNRNQDAPSDLAPRRPGLAGGGKGGGTGPPADSISIWVGSLDPGTCREEVEELFEAHYASVCLVKLIMDPNSGTCRGFGFVHFTDPEEAERALEEMNGAVCRGRRIRVNRSNNSKNNNSSSSSSGGGAAAAAADPSLQNAWRKICAATAAEAERLALECCGGFVATKRKRGVLTGGETARVVVRGLDAACSSEEELRRHFSPFGELLQVRLSAGGKAFLTYAEPLAAAHAVACMHGASVGTAQVAVEHADPLQQQQQQPDYQQDYPAAVAAVYRHPSLLQADPAATATTLQQQQQQLLLLQQQQQQMHAAAQYAQYYPSAYTSAAYGCMQFQPQTNSCSSSSSSKRQRLNEAIEETDLSGGIFRDTDPTLIPSELLPPSMFSLDSLFNRGSQERHVFLPGDFSCQIQIESTTTTTKEINRFSLENDEADELEICFKQADAFMQKKLIKNCWGDKALSPEDQERLYASSDVECCSFVCCY
ncbi:hypothetical protein Emed_002245 [Eimeria media]